MKRFIGYRPQPPAEYLANGTAAPPDQPQYEGVVFTDGSVALRWRTDYKSTSVWSSYADFFHVHGHPEYGTRIEWLDDVHPAELDTLRAVAESVETASDHNTALIRENDRLRAELERYRATVTTGGPPAPFTPGWQPGDSSRPPTAPPVDEVVQLPE